MNFSPLIEYVENVLRKEKGVPACDLKVMRGHETVFRYASGASDYEGKTPVSPKDLYLIYSCTKPMTCAAALQLVEKGIIHLDDPVSKFLPDFAGAFLIRDGKNIPPKRPITIKHLFTMSAGLNYDRSTQPIRDVIAADPHAGTTDIVNALIRSPLQFEPGSKFMYSMCHDVLAAVIEVASGMRFSQYMKQNIWDPLGMQDIGFHIPPEKRSRLSALYWSIGSGKCRLFDDLTDFNLTDRYESGGAGIYTTVDDYSLFSDAMACGGVGATGARILKPETIDLMRAEHLSSYRIDSQFGCSGGAGYGYGLGVRTRVEKPEGQRSSIGEFGWEGAAGAYVLMDPQYDLSIFYVMHVRNWARMIGNGHAVIRDLTYEALGL